MSTATSTATSARRSPARLSTALLTGAGAGLVAAVANVLVSVTARGPFGASDDFQPLDAGPVVLWTVVGAVVGAVGWHLITRRSARSRAVLAKLVPAVLALSLVPDLGLLAGDPLPGQTTAGVVALMVMHLLTAGIAVTAYRRTMPVSRPPVSA